jgi:hypothetical protein
LLFLGGGSFFLSDFFFLPPSSAPFRFILCGEGEKRKQLFSFSISQALYFALRQESQQKAGREDA